MALTGLTQLQPNNIQVVGIATFDQSVGIAGTLTYQDVTNVDAVGIVTARTGVNVSGGQLDVGSNAKIGNAGVATATNFKTGSSNLHSTGLTVGNNFLHSTGINVGTGATIHVPASNVLTLGTNTNERLRINSNGDVTTTGQASFNRQNAGFTARAGDAVSITRASGTPLEINRTGSDGQMISLFDDNTQEAAISLDSGSLVFGLPNSNTERLRIDSNGILLVGHDSSPTSDADKLQVISTSAGTGINLFNYSSSNYGNQIAFMKSRNNTIGSNTILNNGDRIGELNFYGNDGSGRSLGAQIQSRINGTPSNDNTPAAIYLNTGLNQSMQTRVAVLPAGTVGISKNGWATSDHSFGLTVHTGSTSETGPVGDGIMIVSQQNNGNQNSSTGKLMFCGHAQTNGPFLYGDAEQAYGKKGLVFHTLSTANSYSTQLEETARFTHSGRFGLGTGTAVDSLMHIQGNSDSGDEACMLTIEDEDTTAGSKIPSIVFKGNGTQQHRIRGTDTGGLTFADSGNNVRFIVSNYEEAGAAQLGRDSRGWATFRHSDHQGLRTHIRQHYAPGNAVSTYDILRIRRHWWGWGTYKIRCKALYYNSSLESTYYVNGHGSGGNNYSIAQETFGGDASSNNWNCTVTHTASNNSPGSNTTWYADVKVNIPNYYYAIIYIEAYSSQYSTDPNNIGSDSYCLM